MEGILRLYEYNESLNQEISNKHKGGNGISNNLSGKKVKDSDRKVIKIISSLNENVKSLV